MKYQKQTILTHYTQPPTAVFFYIFGYPCINFNRHRNVLVQLFQVLLLKFHWLTKAAHLEHSDGNICSCCSSLLGHSSHTSYIPCIKQAATPEPFCSKMVWSSTRRNKSGEMRGEAELSSFPRPVVLLLLVGWAALCCPSSPTCSCLYWKIFWTVTAPYYVHYLIQCIVPADVTAVLIFRQNYAPKLKQG